MASQEFRKLGWISVKIFLNSTSVGLGVDAEWLGGVFQAVVGLSLWYDLR
jgi:hypothetical protein